MKTEKTKIALVYDFDETLSTGNMQDFSLIPALGYENPSDFWKEANAWSKEQEADQITGSMYYFTKVAKEKNIKLTKEFFEKCGKNIEYYKGVQEWFDRINEYGDSLNLSIEHYLVSAGYQAILKGASITKHFKDTFACSYAFDDNGIPLWPARVVNYSIKVQYLSKINKGLSKIDDVAVNQYMPKKDRLIPFDRMIFFGDGMTDIPSMKMVKERNGNAIAVYPPECKNKKNALTLLIDGRVNFALPADYRKGKEIDNVVKTILCKLATERDLEILKAKEEKKKELKC